MREAHSQKGNALLKRNQRQMHLIDEVPCSNVLNVLVSWHKGKG